MEHQEEARPNFSRVGDIGMASWPIPVSPEELDHLAGQVRVSAVETASASSREGRTGTRPGSLTPRPLSRADLSAKVLAKRPERRSETVRVDAEAESDEVVTETGGSEEREPTRLEWFPVALSRATAPWAQALSEPLRSVAAPLVIWVTSISLADLVSI